ncbi:thiamine pyrophosphate-binding protein [Oryzicola mucosus]|uniref:Thiamine pyrophosphate-binding protein n=1 Tax=Oryzicola mucosus TaxID=2767425 RepID=A0A8J6U629_9HYPH|nr:thiamine pyrophosphate-binding protein [Oryzicola mucosus]MBD0417460.1 thiamine pyrophosphate-binding protein [Oryzicola mucosus]
MSTLENPSSQIVRTESPTQSELGSRWGSDHISDLLRGFDIPFICLNPGSSFRGLHDSIVNGLGNVSPQMLVCLHEEHAVAIAHGYARVTGKPLAVALHANVGLMHATMAIFNAWCDRVPMLILGGTGPVDAARRRPYIDWIHSTRDQASMVRSYVKWDDQPGSLSAAEESLLRGMQMSMTAPQGPVYINLDSDIQEAELSQDRPLPQFSRFAPFADARPSDDVLATAADLLKNARKPAILMGRLTRDKADWDRRVLLAEQLGATVATDLKVGAAFPTAHALHAGPPGMSLSPNALAELREADVILSLDWVDLAGALTTLWPKQTCPAKVIHVSLDHHLHNGSNFEYMALPEVDLHIQSTPDAFVRCLSATLNAPTARSATPQREKGPAAPTGDELTLSDIAQALEAAAEGQPISLTRVPLGWDGGLTDFNHPLDQLGHSGGGGVGSGPGMAVGAALALMGTEHLPVAILGDGDTLMGVTAIWTATHYNIPMLVIVANNRSYFNDELHQERVARRRDRPVENKWIGQRIDDPAPDIAMMARAQGAVGIGPIRDIDALRAAVKDAVAAIRDGKVAVVDVHIAAGYAAAGAS